MYYLTDANANVTAVVSAASGQVAERYAYNAYGTAAVFDPNWNYVSFTLADSTVGNTLGFASMSLDPVTGLYYDEARWYSTAVSNFITQDPALADENLYRYCSNQPADLTDPTGMKPPSGFGGSATESVPSWYYMHWHVGDECSLSQRLKAWSNWEKWMHEIDHDVMMMTFTDEEMAPVDHYVNPKDWPKGSLAKYDPTSGQLIAGSSWHLLYNSPPYVALRHCIASGLLAIRLDSCACAAALTIARDQWRLSKGWTEGEIRADEFDDRAGRQSAGCDECGHNPEHWKTEPQVCESCKQKLLDTKLSMPDV